MYYILVRVWSLAAIGITIALLFVGVQAMTPGSEVGLMLGCGGGIILWMLGIIALSAWLQPKKSKNLFGDTRYNQFSSHRR